MLLPKLIHDCVASFAQKGLFPESWTVLLLETLAFQNIFCRAEQSNIYEKTFWFFKIPK